MGSPNSHNALSWGTNAFLDCAQNETCFLKSRRGPMRVWNVHKHKKKRHVSAPTLSCSTQLNSPTFSPWNSALPSTAATTAWLEKSGRCPLLVSSLCCQLSGFSQRTSGRQFKFSLPLPFSLRSHFLSASGFLWRLYLPGMAVSLSATLSAFSGSLGEVPTCLSPPWPRFGRSMASPRCRRWHYSQENSSQVVLLFVLQLG